MKIMKYLAFIISIIISMHLYGYISIKLNVGAKTPILDEWKYPGKYSPINAFDDDIKTCYAEGWDALYKGSFDIVFNRTISIDEIQFEPGFFKDEITFQRNNRVKILSIHIIDKTNNKPKTINFNFTDEMKMQSKKIDSVTIDGMMFSIQDVYKGSKYNDTCISEIQFYNKGEKITIDDIKYLKKQYILQLEKRLKHMFHGKKYQVNIENVGNVYFESNGIIKYQTTGNINIPLPKRWDIRNSRLFFYYKGKWQLVKYYTDIMKTSALFVDKIGSHNFDYTIEFVSLK